MSCQVNDDQWNLEPVTGCSDHLVRYQLPRKVFRNMLARILEPLHNNYSYLAED